ncbi:hypothetical protein [Vibrio diabolicus]|uniref:hypothetical protein n=1 Tax=Vibrio diabolicus TaxID=50719 RepID=UPI0024949725|nr:hypothetical protein [Vibrio diabolicus]
MKKLLILTDAHYSSIFRVGSHHIIESVNGMNKYNAEVYSTPISIFLFFKLYQFSVRSRIKSFFISNFSNKVYHLPLTILPYRLARKVFNEKISRIICKPIFITPLERQYDMVIIDSVEYLPILDKIKAKKILYRPTDIYSYASKYYLELEEKYIKANNVKLICMSRASANFYSKNGFEVLSVIENGVANAFHNENKSHIKNYSSKPCELKAIYYGALDERIDLDFIKMYIRSGINVDLYGDGSLVERIKDDDILKHYYKGVLDYSKIPKTVAMYHLGLLPFNNDPKNKSRSPMKLYEYLSCGLIVQTTTSFKCDHAESISDENELLSSLEKISQCYAREGVKSIKLERHKIADLHTWDSKSTKILSHIENGK